MAIKTIILERLTGDPASTPPTGVWPVATPATVPLVEGSFIVRPGGIVKPGGSDKASWLVKVAPLGQVITRFAVPLPNVKG